VKKLKSCASRNVENTNTTYDYGEYDSNRFVPCHQSLSVGALKYLREFLTEIELVAIKPHNSGHRKEFWIDRLLRPNA